MPGDPVGIAHAHVALVHGLPAAESAQRLGRSDAAIERHWQTSVEALLTAFARTR